MQLLDDGGSIYALGGQPGSYIQENCLLNSCGSAIFLDNGSEGQTVKANVVRNSSHWLQINKGARHNVIVNNAIDNPVLIQESDNVIQSNYFDFLEEAKPSVANIWPSCRQALNRRRRL
jgi:hypothetical protein